MRVYDLNNKITITKSTRENNYNGYYEIPYDEFEDGKLKTNGSEDFSGKRIKNELKTYEIKKWSGEYDKGNRKIYSHIKYITTNSSAKDIKKLFNEEIVVIKL